MIVTKFYAGQGLGNQLWAYATLRSIAWTKGYDFGIESKSNYKLRNLLPIDLGKRVFSIPHERPYGLKPLTIKKIVFEKQYIENTTGFNIGVWQKEIASISDNTKIEGYFQSLKYIDHFKQELKSMLQCKIGTPYGSDTCVINIRGGDYLGNPDICISKDYYINAIRQMRNYGVRKFCVVTDDFEYARYLLPKYPIVGHGQSFIKKDGKEKKIAWDFSTLQQSQNVILSNSTFCWWAAWTNSVPGHKIAPMYWAYPRNNLKFWSPRDVRVDDWMYLDDSNEQQLGQEVNHPNHPGNTITPLVYKGTLKGKPDVRVRIKSWLFKTLSSMKRF
jgi:hypothetical protein